MKNRLTTPLILMYLYSYMISINRDQGRLAGEPSAHAPHRLPGPGAAPAIGQLKPVLTTKLRLAV